jgi:rod shape-determining protein MreC
MRDLYRFILRNHVIFLFILLEIVSLVFVFNFNNYQKARFLTSANRFTGAVYNRYNRITEYFRLSTVNRQLAEENARLRKLAGIPKTVRMIPDTLRGYQNNELQYVYIAAKVVSNSVNRQQNYITLDKGSNDGIRPEMGVICADGVVGMVTNVTPSYSSVMSLLNVRWNISAKISRNNYFGTLAWNGKDHRMVYLSDIPLHVNVFPGDTIVTSGFSTIFPAGIPLGIIDNVSKEGGSSFYTIAVRLFLDFNAISWVEVIENNKKQELDLILKKIGNDENLD